MKAFAYLRVSSKDQVKGALDYFQVISYVSLPPFQNLLGRLFPNWQTKKQEFA
jgi:hypothetical protein